MAAPRNVQRYDLTLRAKGDAVIETILLSEIGSGTDQEVTRLLDGRLRVFG